MLKAAFSLSLSFKKSLFCLTNGEKIAHNAFMKQKIPMTLAQQETLVGAVMFVLFLVFLGFIHTQASLDKGKTDFTLYASFAGSDGLMKGSAVRLGGVRVGEVTGMTLTNGFRVRARLSFDMPVELSADTSAVIETDGLMGPKHIELIPGGEDELLENDGEIAYTQDAVVLNDLLAKVNGLVRAKKDKAAPVPATEEAKGISDEKESD